ncbi:MAG: 7-carboxy-7-deazaguanine synthase QueE [Magnetococcales bacterium]|nr:7-carboxy-7-deazaguanine synthase QueE [Magnetococcales bacterium]
MDSAAVQHAVCDLFVSVQGEAGWSGRAMFFIRFFGCPLRCLWCDEPRHRDPEFLRLLTTAEIVAMRRELAPAIPHVLLTGGEPLLAPGLIGLVADLKAEGLWVAMETSGVGGEPPSGVDWITLSPKTLLPESWYARADEVKYVVGGEPDPALIEEIHHRAARHPRVWVQPCARGGVPDPEAVALCYRLVLQAGDRLRLSLQTHKWIGVP